MIILVTKKTIDDILYDAQYNGFGDFFQQNNEIFTNPNTLLLFHGGENGVVFPSAFKNNPNKKRDFGDGFYTTYDVEQAIRCAKRKHDATGYGAVSVYEYTGELTGLIFPKDPTYEWLDFVVQCRSQKCRHDEYDIIAGPVADDNVADTIEQYINNYLTADEALTALAYYEESDQTVFTNDVATQHLQFLGWLVSVVIFCYTLV